MESAAHERLTAMDRLPAPGQRELRSFGLAMAVAFPAVFGLLLPWIFSARWPLWPWLLAAVFSGLALAAPARLGLVYRYWMRMAAVLGWVNTRILLFLIFCILFVPIGLARRLVAPDPMARRVDRRLPTYRTPSMKRDSNHHEFPY